MDQGIGNELNQVRRESSAFCGSSELHHFPILGAVSVLSYASMSGSMIASHACFLS
jgi:hypothetical protein